MIKLSDIIYLLLTKIILCAVVIVGVAMVSKTPSFKDLRRIRNH